MAPGKGGEIKTRGRSIAQGYVGDLAAMRVGDISLEDLWSRPLVRSVPPGTLVANVRPCASYPSDEPEKKSEKLPKGTELPSPLPYTSPTQNLRKHG